MVENVTYPHLHAAVMTGLTCVEQGLEPKRIVRDTILGYVEENYIRADRVAAPEDIPVAVLDRLHEAFGLSFEAHGGKLAVVTDRALAARTA